MVTRRDSVFLYPNVLEGGEMGELALTPAQIANNLYAARRSYMRTPCRCPSSLQVRICSVPTEQSKLGPPEVKVEVCV